MADPNNVKSIFSAAADKPAAERAAFLDEATGSDTALRVRVEALLKAHDNPDSFLKEPAAEFGATIDLAASDSPLAERPGTLIGPYKLLEQIGEGGMGVVYMADQQAPVRRRVALKVIKTGMDTRQVIARFEAERQALALMDHTNIARVLDAGATDTGRPYFVMELVRGIPITAYCDQNNLPVHERLELFIQVCHAVQHAHQKGIIHRDLKPSNVLVTLNDGRAVPKVIDFGVAKATGQQLTEKTLFTAFAQMVGTPLYMSPEQAEMTSIDIDTRSDVYSLGVLLYELLTGTTPFDQDRLRAAAFDEIRRIIREEEPPKPSTRLSDSKDSLPSVSALRHTEPVKLTKLVAGDLDWIAMKCLEKDRNRRYETATGLAEDIQRYLSDQPVEAGRPTRTYRLKKFVRRNKVGVLAGSAIALALALGTVVSTWQALRADREAKNARTQAARSDQVAKFLKDMLKSAGPSVARGRDATLLREILDNTAERADKDLQDQPEVRGELWFTLGKVFSDIGDRKRAISMYQNAVDSYRIALGNENSKLALALGRLGGAQSWTGDVATGKANAQLGLDMARNCGDRETLATCLESVAYSLRPWGQAPYEAEPYWREAIVLRRQFDNDPVALADCMHGLAGSLHSNDEAESLEREALALYRQHLGTDHPRYVAALFSLGQQLIHRDKLEEAETVLRQTHDLYRKIYDKNNPYQPIVLRFLAMVLASRGKWDEAEALIREGMDIEAQSSTNDGYHDDSIMLVRLKASRGQLQEALQESARLIERYPHDDFLKLNRAIVLLQTGNLDECRQLCHELLKHDSYQPTMLLTARVAFLVPADGADLDRACRWADAAKPDDLKSIGSWLISFAHLTKALAEYRRGRFESAKDLAIRTTSSAGAESCYAAQAWAIQALAAARLDEIDEARAALNKCDELRNEPHVDFIAWLGGGGCGEWAAADLLRREAAELLGISEPAPATAPAAQP